MLLRGFLATDVPTVRDVATDEYVPLVGSLPAFADDAQATDWIGRQKRRYDEGVGFSFAVAEAISGQMVGTAGLWLSQLPYGRATVGYSIAPTCRGNGYATEALTALTAFAWQIPALHRIEAHIEPWNTASILTAERAGYALEGLMRSHQEIGGQRRDMLLYAAIRL